MAYGTVKVDAITSSTQTLSVDAIAKLASPALTGTPTAPTASANDSTTKIATTEYVQTELLDYATLASPALTGTPTAPTPTADDSSTKVATTAFVMTELVDYATLAHPTFTSNIELSAQAPVKFMDANSSNYVALRAPSTVSANVTWTLPATDGAANTLLSTDGSGNLGWTTPSFGASLGLAIALG